MRGLEVDNSDASFGIVTDRELERLTQQELQRANGGNLTTGEITRVLKCPHCPRAIIESALGSQIQKVHGERATRTLGLLLLSHVEVVDQPCDHHGGEEYNAAEHMQIDV